MANLSGTALLEDPKHNRGTAFTQTEREQRGLVGLLPPVIETLKNQVKRCLFQLSKKNNDLEQYIYLAQLADDNRTLFYAVLATDPARFLKIVYDPTSGHGLPGVRSHLSQAEWHVPVDGPARKAQGSALALAL